MLLCSGLWRIPHCKYRTWTFSGARFQIRSKTTQLWTYCTVSPFTFLQVQVTTGVEIYYPCHPMVSSLWWTVWNNHRGRLLRQWEHCFAHQMAIFASCWHHKRHGTNRQFYMDWCCCQYIVGYQYYEKSLCLRMQTCCEYTNIFSFSPLFKVSITFLISFRLPLFRLYYLETTDIFPTFFQSNTLLI